jgi:hypothetical protein
MKRNLQRFAAAGSLLMFAAEAAFAQKRGGILKMYSPDSPASMSKSASTSYGRSNGNWRRSVPDRLSFTIAARPAGILR